LARRLLTLLMLKVAIFMTSELIVAAALSGAPARCV
jgi:hypothetical protein